MEDVITARAEPFCLGIRDCLSRDLRFMATLVPTLVACITEDNHIA